MLKKDVAVKTLVTLVIISLYYYLKSIKFYVSDFNGSYYDRILEEFILPFSIYLGQNFYIRDFVLHIGAITLDTIFIFFAFFWVLYGRGWKELLGFGMFYGIRGIFLNMLEFYIPEGVLNEYPGFFYFMTPFGRANDFFYSGHTGCAFLTSLFINEYGYKEIFYVGIVITLIQGFVMMVTRVHFFIDILFGFCLAHFFKIISHPLGKFVDYYLPIFGNMDY